MRRKLPLAIFVFVLPALIAFALYTPTLRNAFLSDDYTLLLNFHEYANPGDKLAALGHMFVSGVGPPSNQYRPLTMASFALNETFNGANATAWRLVNVMLHAANTALVSLFVWLLAKHDTRNRSAMALAAGVLFAAFPPSAEAVAWIASRFDGMALFWMLLATCGFVRSERWTDRYAAMSLAATVLAFMSKESAAILVPLIAALAWWKQPAAEALADQMRRALLAAWPWLAIALGYFLFRIWIFGDPFRFFPGTSPASTLLSGAWIASLLDLGRWWPRAMPETLPRIGFNVSLLCAAILAAATSIRDRAACRLLIAIVVAAAGAFALLLSHWRWPTSGEGGRVLYTIAAIAAVALVVPLASASSRLKSIAWVTLAVMVTSEVALVRGAIARSRDAQQDMQKLVAKIADTARELSPGEYAFVVVPDHVGPVVFGRNAQAGLLSPPVQPEALSHRLIVQTPLELDRWPDLFSRDIIGRLQREPLSAVSANVLTPKVATPPILPDRHYCWSPERRSLVRISIDVGQDLTGWSAQWRESLAAAGCTDRNR